MNCVSFIEVVKYSLSLFNNSSPQTSHFTRSPYLYRSMGDADTADLVFAFVSLLLVGNTAIYATDIRHHTLSPYLADAKNLVMLLSSNVYRVRCRLHFRPVKSCVRLSSSPIPPFFRYSTCVPLITTDTLLPLSMCMPSITSDTIGFLISCVRLSSLPIISFSECTPLVTYETFVPILVCMPLVTINTLYSVYYCRSRVYPIVSPKIKCLRQWCLFQPSAIVCTFMQYLTLIK